MTAVLGALVLCVRLSDACCAQDSASPPASVATESPLMYRRIFVPAEKVDAWPTEGRKFLPVESQDFERWVQAANEATGDVDKRAAITRAEYLARLEGDQLVGNRGEWTIALRGAAPVFLALGEPSIDVNQARWRGSPQLPVRLGTWGRSGGLAEREGLEVSASGVLEFAWSAASKATHSGIELPLRLPPAHTTRLTLDLSEGQEPHVDGGVVISSERLPIESSDYSVRRRRWVLQIDAANSNTLRIEDPRATQKADIAGLLLHENLQYSITQRGVDITATWHLDATGELPSELTLAIPSGIELTSAEGKGGKLVWRVATDAETDERRAVIKLPTIQTAEQPRVILRAWSPIVTDRLWQLPKLRPEGIEWASGQVELAVAAELELREIKPADCIEIGSRNLTGAEGSPETWRLAAYSSNAALEILVARRPPEVAVRLGSSLAMGDPDIAGRLVTEWNIARGSVQRLSGELTDDWVVESVETLPADALGEWFVDERDGGRAMEIQLAQSATPAAKVSVIIAGRLPRAPFDDRLTADTMRMVRWKNARVVEHDLAFQTTESYAVEPLGELPQIAVNELGDDRRTLLGSDLLENAVFDLSQAGRDAGLRLAARRGQFTADIKLDVTLSRQQRRQAFAISVTPTSNRIDRLLVYSTEPLGEGARWAEAAALTVPRDGERNPVSGGPLTATRLGNDDPRVARLPSGGELWLVELSRPTSRTFAIELTNTGAKSESEDLPLLALPEAIQQSGQVWVRGDMNLAAALEARRMRPAVPPLAPVEPESDIERRPVRAAYHYDPAKCFDAADAPRLQMLPSGDGIVTSLVAERITIESFYEPQGGASHNVTLQLQCHGEETLEVCLPSGAQLQAAEVDGRQVTPVESRDAECVRVPLPKDEKIATATISFTTTGKALSPGSKLQPPSVHGQISILQGEWIVQLPEQYTISDAAEFNWRRRLFGPLARDNHSAPFQPSRPGEWIRLVNSITAWGGDRGAGSVSLAGWREYRKDFVAALPAAVYVAHPPLVNAWSVSAFLLCLVGGSYIRRRGRAALLVMTAVAAGLALALPAVVAPLATGALLGFALSLILGQPKQEYTEGGSWRASALTAAGAVVFALVVGLAGESRGQPADATTVTNQAIGGKSLHRLLIPVDQAGQRAGTKYFVSEEFLRELLRIDGKATATGGDWLLTAVSYSGELRAAPEPASVVAGEWSIACDVETLSRDTTVVLPLARDEATWPASAIVDGVPTPISWLEQGPACALTIAEPGEHTIVIAFTPVIVDAGGEWTVKLSVPQHRGAMLTIERPPALEGMSVSGERIADGPAQSGNAKFELDGSETLTLRWPPSNVTASSPRRLQITQLEWLHVGEDGLAMDTKYVLEGNVNAPDGLTVEHDPEWELEVEEGASVERLPPDEATGRAAVRVALAADDAGKREITLRWRNTTGPQFGRTRAPAVEVVGQPVAQRWRAVSSAPSLECEALADGAQQATAIEFLAVWGKDELQAAPQSVIKTSQVGGEWAVEVLPHVAPTEVLQSIQAAVGSDAMRVLYEAQVTPGRPQQHRVALEVPPDLAIDEIVIRQADRQIPVRWSRAEDNRVSVFFGERLDAAYRLTLRGSVPANAELANWLPWLAAIDAGSSEASVHLYRDEDVMLNVQGLPETAVSDAPPGVAPSGWRARWLGSYRLTPSAAAKVRIDIGANYVKLAGDTWTFLAMVEQNWIAGFHCEVAVERGVLDALRLDVPPEWKGPFTLDSSVASTIEPPSEADRRLTIRFTDPIPAGSRLRLDLRGPLEPSALPVAVPSIVAEPQVEGRRYVSVPESAEGRMLSWKDAGLKQSRLPTAFTVAREGRRALRSFEVVDSQFQLALAPPAGAPHDARVRMADAVVSRDELGRQILVTRYLIEPQGVGACEIQVGNGQQVVEMRLDGRPAVVRLNGESKWRVLLGPPRLPCVLEVVTKLAGGGSPDMSGQNGLAIYSVRRPTLVAGGKAIPVDIGVWTFRSDTDGVRPTVARAASVTAAEQTALRFERMLSMAEAGKAAAMELPSPERASWLRTWGNQLVRLREEARELQTAPANRPLASQISPPQDDQLAAASARLDQWLEQIGEAMPEVVTHRQPEMGAKPQAVGGEVYLVTAGELDVLDLDAPPSAAWHARARFFGVAAVAFVCGACLWLMRWPAACDFVYRWPHAVAFVAGLAYWAWMRPSWLGLLIAAGSLLLAVRSGWPGRAIRMEGSTVLRAGRPR